MGLIQALGVFIDTIVICSCTAFILLLVPEELTRGLMGMELLQTASYVPQHIDQDHLSAFYRTFDQVKDRTYDGLIITGAPVENLDFCDVEYWDELCQIMEWSKEHVHATLHICWGAQAGLFYHYGIQKHTLPERCSASSPTRSSVPAPPGSGALTTCSTRLTPVTPR